MLFKSLKTMTTFNLTGVYRFCAIIYFKNIMLFLKECIISRFNQVFYKHH